MITLSNITVYFDLIEISGSVYLEVVVCVYTYTYVCSAMEVWEQEACGRLCERQSKKLQNTIETISGLIDVKDMQLSQITRDFLNLTKMLAEVDQKQYPETLGRMFIINVPSVFPFVWRMVKVWMELEFYCNMLHLSLITVRL